MARGTCRCVMCGIKNAGKTRRGIYIKNGIGSDEYASKGETKVRERRRLRKIMKRKMLDDV